MTHPSITDDRLPSLAEHIRTIAEDAGRIIMEIYRDGFEVTEKSDATPVTDADHAAETAILPRLVKSVPNISYS